MRKRRQVIYVKKSSSGLSPQSRDTDLSSRSPHIRLPTINKAAVRMNYSYYPVDINSCHELEKLKTAGQVKLSLMRISGLSASINWVATLLGFFVISGEDDKLDPSTLNCLKLGVGSASLLQASLVCWYWKYSLKHFQVTKTAVKRTRNTGVGLQKSPAVRWSCMLESAFQLFVFVPWVSFTRSFTLFGVDTELSLDDLIYAFVLLRNYHTLRFLYWFSRFSALRTFIYAQIMRVGVTPAFTFRYFLAEYGLYFFLIIFTGMTLIYGLLSFATEEIDTDSGPTEVWNKIWLVAYTDATIGYGDIVPTTLLGRLVIICCCIWGILMHGAVLAFTADAARLNLTECSMCSELLYVREKTKYSQFAVRLIQDWWRFILMRKRKCAHGFAVVAFYSQLRVYRRVLVKCQLVKDHRFERQVTAFGETTHTRIRTLNEYLRPVIYTASLIHDVVRETYKVKMKTKALAKLIKRTRIHAFPSHSSLIQSKTVSYFSFYKRLNTEKVKRLRTQKSGQERAKAKISAYKNVQGRLIRPQMSLNSPVFLDDEDQLEDVSSE